MTDTTRRLSAEMRETLAISFPSDMNDPLADALHDLDVLERELKTARMRLAACSIAANQNTLTSVKARLATDSPYYSAAYGDVCAVVDREMNLRAEERRKFGKDWLKSNIRLALQAAEVAAAFTSDGEQEFIGFNPQDIDLLSEMLSHAIAEEMEK